MKPRRRTDRPIPTDPIRVYIDRKKTLFGTFPGIPAAEKAICEKFGFTDIEDYLADRFPGKATYIAWILEFAYEPVK